jgi:hypothetical protein
MSVSRRKFIKSGTLGALSAGLTLSAFGSGFAQKTKQEGSVVDQKSPNVDRKIPIVDRKIPVKVEQDPLAYYKIEAFEPYIGSIFQAPDAQGRMVSLTLVSVIPYQPRKKSKVASKTVVSATDSFSLTFQSTQRLPPFTSIHKMSHPALGNFDLFLKPYEKDGTMYYEAVFNRLR